ncbi:hypothetical protein LCGC14_1292090 [marine sediment metagenome]|uniref:Uncharacterized protein n=1 Tax=marine sediment metagenome TaxID=412755 RepID=A0A0F9KTT1_9ZZZZ
MTDKQLFVTQIADTPSATSAHNDTLGDIRWVGNKCYKYVKLAEGAIAVVAGVALHYLATPAAGYNVNIVTADVSTADTIPIAAGVSISAPADTNHFWMQIKGAATLLASTNVTGTPSAGQGVQSGATDSDFAVNAGVGAGVDAKLQIGAMLSTTVINLDCMY